MPCISTDRTRNPATRGAAKRHVPRSRCPTRGCAASATVYASPRRPNTPLHSHGSTTTLRKPRSGTENDALRPSTKLTCKSRARVPEPPRLGPLGFGCVQSGSLHSWRSLRIAGVAANLYVSLLEVPLCSDCHCMRVRSRVARSVASAGRRSFIFRQRELFSRQRVSLSANVMPFVML